VAKAPAPAVRVAAITPAAIELALGFDVSSHTDAQAAEDAIRRATIRQFADAGIALPSTVTRVELIKS
jgi:small-conductance mechanosensitive channel